MILGVVIRPILIHKIAAYPIKEILSVFKSCLKVVLTSAPIVVLIDVMFMKDLASWQHIILTGLLSVAVSTIAIYFLGIDRNMRKKIYELVRERINKR